MRCEKRIATNSTASLSFVVPGRAVRVHRAPVAGILTGRAHQRRGFLLGRLNLYRAVYDHPAFNTLTEASVFIWMTSKAAWKPHEIRYKGKRIKLDRGQFAISTRDFARAWGWSEAKVRRFLGALHNDAMADAASDAGVNVITICNYDKYQNIAQSGDAPTDALTDAAATQRRRTERNNINNTLPYGRDGTSSEASPKVQSFDSYLYAFGKEVLGRNAGGLITKLIKAKGSQEAENVLKTARDKQDPKEYVGGVLATPKGEYYPERDEMAKWRGANAGRARD